MYAAGRIPGSFFRREGRPSEDAILTCRLIDRPLRPTFAKGLRNEVQVVITVLSLDPQHLYDVLAINGASASTQLSGLPFSGPIGGVRQKMRGAANAGASIFLVPQANCSEATDGDDDGLKLVKITKLADAISSLKALADDPDAKVPACS